MPPKKGKRKGSIPSPPSTPTNEPSQAIPSLSSEAFIADILRTLKEDDIHAVPAQLAMSMNIGDHTIDLRSSILVDFVFENLAFAADHNFAPHKTVSFLQDMEKLKQLVLAGETLEELQAAFKAQILQRTKEIPPDPEVQRQIAAQAKAEEAAQLQLLQQSQTKKDSKQKKEKQPKEPLVVLEKKEDIIPQPVVYSLQDVTDLMQYVISGIFQHYKLYCYAFGGPTREAEDVGSHRLFCETVMAAPSLQKARTEQQYIEWLAMLRLTEQAEEEKKREEEEARRKQRELEEAEEEKKRLEEIARQEQMAAHQVSLTNKDAEKIILAIGNDLNATTNARQDALLKRIMALEDRLPKSVP